MLSHSKTSQEGSKSFRHKRTQPYTCCARITKWQRRRSRGNEWTKLRDFLPGIVKIPTSAQMSRFTTTWLSSRFHNSSKIVENSAHLEWIWQQKQTWRPPRKSSGHSIKEIVHVRKPTTRGYHTKLFLVPDPMIWWWPVIDFSLLNSHLHVPTFKMETAESIRKSIRKGEWVISIDLTDAYFHVPIHPQSQKYLRFQTKKRGFPVSSSSFWCRDSFPRVHSHCQRGQTHSSSQEPQNPSISVRLASSVTNKRSMSQDSEKLVQLVQELGWLINFQKSELIPTQKLVFLGYHFDLQKGLVFPTQKKLDRLNAQTVSIRKSLVLTPRKLMSLIGTLASLEKAVPLGRLHMRPFQWYLESHWKFPQSLDKRIPVTGNFLEHLKWWEELKNLMAGTPIHPQVHNTLVFTDASQKGGELT